MDGYQLYYEQTCRAHRATPTGWADPINQAIGVFWIAITVLAVVGWLTE